MSVSSELSRLSTAKSNLATSIANKGVTVPVGTKIDGYAALVDSITGGGIACGMVVNTVGASGSYHANNVTLYCYNGYLLDDICRGQSSSGFSVTWGNTVTIFGTGCFQDCTSLTSFTIPSTVTEIFNDCFKGCIALTSMAFPSSLTTLFPNCFSNCTALTKIWIPSSVTTIYAITATQAPFLGCASTLKIFCEAASAPSGWGAYWNYYSSTKKIAPTFGATLAQYQAA